MVAELKINITLMGIIFPITYIKIKSCMQKGVQKWKRCNIENILWGFLNENMTFKKERKENLALSDLNAHAWLIPLSRTHITQLSAWLAPSVSLLLLFLHNNEQDDVIQNSNGANK